MFQHQCEFNQSNFISENESVSMIIEKFSETLAKNSEKMQQTFHIKR